MNHRSEAIDLLEKMLTINPQKRISAKKALEEPYFKLELGQAPSHVGYRDLPAQGHHMQHDQVLFHPTLLHNTIQQNWEDESKSFLPCEFSSLILNDAVEISSFFFVLAL
jgi:serine/threonine protein kinase